MSRPVLKIWPADLEQIRMGRKRSEVRRCDDRKFRVGDELELEAWEPEGGRAVADMGREAIRVTHVERLAGPLLIAGISEHEATAVPLAVLSFELL